MFKNKSLFFNSLKYVIVSGASKGFNYILLLYFAIGVYSGQYVTILLLLSLEQILSLLLPLNNSHIIYSKTITKYELITNKLISSSIIVLIIYLFLFFILKQSIYKYFEVDKIIIFLSIFVSMLINSYLVYLTNYYKLIEKHNKALLIQGLLLISFLSILISIYVIDDIIVAFFLGKTIGLFIAFITILYLGLNKFKYKYKTLSLIEFKKIINLFSISILGWVSGFGFMNIAKIYSTPDELIRIGYILNIYNVFLLLSIGINAVYNPLIKKYILKKDLKMALGIKIKTLFVYLLIAFLSIIFYFVLLNTINFDFNLKIKAIFSITPYTVLIFVFSGFVSVVQPFYMISEKFKTYNIINIVSYLLWVLLMLVCTYFGYQNYIWFLILIYFLKAVFSYFYAKYFLMNKEKYIIE